MDNERDRKIDVTAILFLLVQNRQQTHGWTLIGSDANGLGLLEWRGHKVEEIMSHELCRMNYVAWIMSHELCLMNYVAWISLSPSV